MYCMVIITIPPSVSTPILMLILMLIVGDVHSVWLSWQLAHPPMFHNAHKTTGLQNRQANQGLTWLAVKSGLTWQAGKVNMGGGQCKKEHSEGEALNLPKNNHEWGAFMLSSGSEPHADKQQNKTKPKQNISYCRSRAEWLDGDVPTDGFMDTGKYYYCLSIHMTLTRILKLILWILNMILYLILFLYLLGSSQVSPQDIPQDCGRFPHSPLQIRDFSQIEYNGWVQTTEGAEYCRPLHQSAPSVWWTKILN